MSDLKSGFTSRREGETNISHLTRRIAWACAADLVPISADARTQLSDLEREKRMLEELDRVKQRIKDARWEYAKAEEVFATNITPVEALKFTCLRCRNSNPDFLYMDPRSGDTICRGIKGDDNCGEVMQDHRVDRGAAKRNFEDTEDRNHHGPVGNPYMPDSVNMRTSFNTFARGPGAKNGEKLAKISNLVEMGISNLGHDNRASTRVGYKTNQKNEAFRLMVDWGIALQIHDVSASHTRCAFASLILLLTLHNSEQASHFVFVPYSLSSYIYKHLIRYAPKITPKLTYIYDPSGGHRACQSRICKIS